MFEITPVGVARFLTTLLGLWSASSAGAAYARATGRADAAGSYSRFARYLFIAVLLLGILLVSIP